MSESRKACRDCRYYYEFQPQGVADPLAELCWDYDPNAIQCFCCWDTKDEHTFADRPACRRFEAFDE